MHSQTNVSDPLDAPQIPVQLRLAAAWTSFMFLYIYVDFLVLHKPGHLDGILHGRIWEFEINQTFVTGALISVSIPILMILLSTTLPGRVVRAANLVVAVPYIPYSVFNAVGESWTVFFGLSIGVEVLILAFILRTAWTWPRTQAAASANAAATADHLPRQAHA